MASGVVCVPVFFPGKRLRGTSEAAKRGGAGSLWLERVARKGIYQLPLQLQPQQQLPISTLPFPQQGITTYFSGNCTMEDAKLAQDFLTHRFGGWASRG